MIRYITIDDEPLAHDLIDNFCTALPHLESQKRCYDAFEALQFLSNHSVDLIFLDINMPKLKGFDLLRTLQNPPKVIVTTAYQEFALEGYELDVADYLLKPFSFERFVKAVNKAVSKTESNPSPKPIQNTDNQTNKPQRFFIKGDKKYHQIEVNQILYVEAYGNYTKLFLDDKMIICHEKISSFESLLPSESFLRVHKSFIVALDKIETIEGNTILIQKNQVPIGQTYRSTINSILNKGGIG